VQTKWFLRNEFEQCLTNSFGQTVTSSLPALSALLRQFQVSVFGKSSRPVAAPIHANIGLKSIILPASSDRASGETYLIMSGGVDCQREGSIHNLNDDAQSVTTWSIKPDRDAARVEQDL
jgi:hypothetical protein